MKEIRSDMANGEIFQAIKMILERNPEAISESSKYQLMLGGIFELYRISGDNKLEVQKIMDVVKPMLFIYKILVIIGGIFISTLIAFLWGVLTGQIQIVYK